MSVKNKELSKEKAFYFFTAIGNYTGESAASIEDFTRENCACRYQIHRVSLL
jgi:hypothetical protein